MAENGLLKIQVRDDTGRLSPCRLHIKSADGACYVPPDVFDPTY